MICIYWIKQGFLLLNNQYLNYKQYVQIKPYQTKIIETQKWDVKKLLRMEMKHYNK